MSQNIQTTLRSEAKSLCPRTQETERINRVALGRTHLEHIWTRAQRSDLFRRFQHILNLEQASTTYVMSKLFSSLEEQYAHLNAVQLRRVLIEHLTKQKLGLYWEHDSLERDTKLNGNVVLPVLDEQTSLASVDGSYHNLVIEGGVVA